MNDIQHIKHLLQRFYDGTSTVEEEQRLCDYFCNADNVPEELKTDQKMFRHLSECNAEVMPSEDFEQRLLSALHTHTKRSKIRWKRFTAVAASVAILVGIGITFYIKSNRNPYEVTDPQLAYAITQEALLNASEKLNKVDRQLEKVSLILNKTNRKHNQQ
jgi:hypothetical protein